jgi:hypothetical protein
MIKVPKKQCISNDRCDLWNQDDAQEQSILSVPKDQYQAARGEEPTDVWNAPGSDLDEIERCSIPGLALSELRRRAAREDTRQTASHRAHRGSGLVDQPVQAIHGDLVRRHTATRRNASATDRTAASPMPPPCGRFRNHGPRTTRITQR